MFETFQKNTNVCQLFVYMFNSNMNIFRTYNAQTVSADYKGKDFYTSLTQARQKGMTDTLCQFQVTLDSKVLVECKK